MKGKYYFVIDILLAAGILALPVMMFMGYMLIFGAMAHSGVCLIGTRCRTRPAR